MNHYCDISEAVKAAKVSRHAILKLMNSGGLSFKTEESGKKVILISDLQKAFNLAEGSIGQVRETVSDTNVTPTQEEAQLQSLRAEIASLKETIRIQSETIASLQREISQRE